MTFECGLCDYWCKIKSNLRKHMDAIHKNKTYNCDDFHKSYRWHKDLTDHVKVAHCEWELKCKNCDYQAPLLRYLKTHIKAKHN